MHSRTEIFHTKKIRLNPLIEEISELKVKTKHYEIWEVADFLYVLLCPVLESKECWELDEFNSYEHFFNWVKRKERCFDEEYVNAIHLKRKLMKKFFKVIKL